jgi:ketosteroid isomerase-like protein
MNTHAMPTKDEIIALEKSYWDAIKAKDGDRTTELSAKSSLVTGARGVMRIAKEKMGKMTEEGEWTLDSYAFDDVEVSIPAPDVALIAYTVRQSVTMDGKSQDLRAADSSVWIRGTNGWECHAHSESFLK